MNKQMYTAAAICERFGLQLKGDGAVELDAVAPLDRAGPRDLSFVVNDRYASQLAACTAGAVIVSTALADAVNGTALIAANPHVAFAKVATLFERPLSAPVGIHPSAVVSPLAKVAASASIGPCSVIEDDAVIEDDVIIGPNCVVGPDCVVGAGSRLVAQVTLVLRVRLGKRVLIHPGAVLGADGFGLAFDNGHWIKIPQLGGVRLGDDCEVGANTTIDRGALEDTVLADDCRLDDHIHIAHNVEIGAHTVMAGFTGVAGSAKIGSYCQFGARAGVFGHLEITDKVTLTGCAVATGNIREAGVYTSNNLPLLPSRDWFRNAARFKRLDELVQRVAALEKE
ncbi:UDP-3-O-(3-hydroxymyristoyl)glucosamine N-acyltransferase [Frateuria aurantia]|uniref:UDP-3-O-acylglucosamine N-acyltransferase n=1 Tax=Frateuria aurantia (strain ATCC 33424 / DSM 6220 / KCTC 2777 / LMG 1558 / NBRC 3245 / NCIMB 13370) TaxID=767434 RepID=H8KZ83_FRAAD|nr:UDP-3-O-(3-hydroxymyristoyl)glucosamine N-acyltransferase [Frateuria aurantia]AFC85187.1 UDP-3-O-(3-hydroxymyristoyl) glucosamine N-acyltransferase [Frateuria aurantia DSM 6220]